jgi:hypothetical protein
MAGLQPRNAYIFDSDQMINFLQVDVPCGCVLLHRYSLGVGRCVSQEGIQAIHHPRLAVPCIYRCMCCRAEIVSFIEYVYLRLGVNKQENGKCRYPTHVEAII